MNKPNLLLGFISIFFLIIFFSCQKENLELDDIENRETTDVLSFKKNGSIWKPKIPTSILHEKLEYNNGHNNFNISASRVIKDQDSNCIECDFFNLKTNVIVDTGFLAITYSLFSREQPEVCEINQPDLFLLDSMSNNFIQVIELDTVKNAIAGYFQFTAINNNPLCNDTLTVTEGRFRLGFD